MNKLKVLSLFNGISCGRLALERANIEVEKYVSCEIDFIPNSIAKYHYPNDTYLGDVFKVDFSQFEGFDLLIGGSPCNYWTIAKTNRETTSEGLGFELFKQFIRAYKESKCKYFLYENNESITKEIKNEISKYLEVSPIMINSALVSAQNRKRLYWTNIPNIIQPKDLNIKISDIIGVESYCLIKQPFMRRKINGVYDRRFEPRLDNKSGTIVGTNAGQSNMIAIKTNKELSNCYVKNSYFYGFGKEYPIKLPDGYYIIRSLDINEMEQLQTLPIGYTSIVKPSYARKCIGNGWTVDVIAFIFSHLKQYI